MNETETLMSPVHPGEILREDFMKPLGLTVHKLAPELHVLATRIGEIVHDRKSPLKRDARSDPGRPQRNRRQIFRPCFWPAGMCGTSR
ncbi:MAG: HigA family addiction module antitoxin [Candidatus Acidiferrales bacterium]|jgi:hypothetical protein